MISQAFETMRVECDDDECFESILVQIGADNDIAGELFMQEWTVLFDPIDGSASFYCPRHVIIEAEEWQ